MDNTVTKIILGLSKREKEFFSEFSNLDKNKSRSNYLSIYNHILCSGNFNISELKKSYNDDNFLKYSSMEKEKLLEKLLVSSLNFSLDKNDIWKLIKDILFIRILIEKDSISKAKKYIHRAKLNAYKYEEFNLLLNILEIEENLCFNRCIIIDYDKLKKLKEERKKINEIIDNINDLLTIKAEIQQYQCDENYYTSELDNFIKHYKHNPQIPRTELKSIKALGIWLYINYVTCFIINEYSKGFSFVKENYELYHKKPELFSKDEYLQIMNNYLFFCCLNKNETDFHILIQELSQTKNATKEEFIFIQKIKFYRTLELYHQIERFEEAEKLSCEAEEFLEIINPLVDSYLNRYLQMLIIRAFIESHNYQAALLISLKHFKNIGFDFDSSTIKLFEFIAHYKLGNFENLLYSVDSWTKTIRSKRIQFPIEKALIKFFRSVCNKTTIKEKKLLISKTIVELKKIEKAKQKFYLNHIFDFAAWFERELEEMK